MTSHDTRDYVLQLLRELQQLLQVEPRYRLVVYLLGIAIAELRHTHAATHDPTAAASVLGSDR